MQKNELFAIFVYIIIPLLGLVVFLFINRKMRLENIVNPPTMVIFIVFTNYGGLLLLVLTAYFLEWSGAASLGVFYLIFIAPVVMAFIAYKPSKNRHVSIYHKRSFIACISYFVIAPLVFLVLYLTIK